MSGYRRFVLVVLFAFAMSAVGYASWRSRPDRLVHPAAIAPALSLPPVVETVPDAPEAPEAPAVEEATAPPRMRTFATTNGRRLDLGGSGVAAFLERIAPLARRGDAIAAYQVYQAEAICAAMEREADGIRAARVQDVDAMAKWREGAAATIEACAGVSPAQVQERFGFLEQAIRAGIRDAMSDFRTEGPLGVDPSTLEPNDWRLIAWRRAVGSQLEVLAGQGDRSAWIALAGDYQTGRTVDKDFRAAVKYRTSVVATGRQPDRDPATVGSIKDMARTMQPEEVQEAIVQGRALAKRFPQQRP